MNKKWVREEEERDCLCDLSVKTAAAATVELRVVVAFLLMVGLGVSLLWLVLGDAQTREKKMCHTFCFRMAFS